MFEFHIRIWRQKFQFVFEPSHFMIGVCIVPNEAGTFHLVTVCPLPTILILFAIDRTSA
jgi:hypothetical protein